MKICFFQLKIQDDGSSKALLNLLSSLKDLEYEILVVLARKSVYCEYLQKAGIEYILYPFRPSVYKFLDRKYARYILTPLALIYTVIVNLKAILFLSKKLSNSHIDIIHTNVSTIHVGYFISKILSIPHIWHLRELQGTQYSSKPLLSMQYMKHLCLKSYNICVSKTVFQCYGCDKLNSSVIYDGVKSGLSSHEYGSNRRAKRLLFVGRIEKSKGVEMLLEGYSRFIKDYSANLELWFIGGGEDKYIKFLQERANKNQVGHLVKFIGIRSDVGKIMQGSLATIVSSFSEGFGLVLVESMLSKCYVIGYNVEGTKELLDNVDSYCKSILSNRYLDAEELAFQLNKLWQISDKEYQANVDKVYNAAQNLYDEKNNISQILSFYDLVLTKKHKKES